MTQKDAAKTWRKSFGIKVDACLNPHDYYVYYLCHNREVVYVGQSASVLGRMASHMHGKGRKAFDTVLYTKCQTEEEMLTLERQEIERLRPTYNVKHNPDCDEIRICCVLCGRQLNYAPLFFIRDDENANKVCLCSRCETKWSSGCRPQGVQRQKYQQRIIALAEILERSQVVA